MSTASSGKPPKDDEREKPPEERADDERAENNFENGSEAATDTQADADDDADGQDDKRGFGDIMSAIFLPMLPALIGAGLLQGFTSLLTVVGVLDEGTGMYTVLTTISSAIFYFLPFLLAVTTARAFDASPYLAIAVVAFFLHPDMVAAMESPEPLSLAGIPVVKTTYTSSVIPIILMIWGMSVIQHLIERHVSERFKTIIVPPVVILVTTIVGLLVLGPLGALLTQGVTAVVTGLSDHVPWLLPVVVGALGSLMASVGLTFALFPIALLALTSLGFDNVYGPGMLASNMALAGTAVAVAMKAENRTYQAFTYSAAVTALLGVVQPVLFGVVVPLKRPLASVIAGGAAGGLVAGLSGFHVYALMPAGLTAIPAWFSSEGFTNALWGAAVVIVAFVVSFVVQRLVGYDQPSQETVDELTN